jgi:hypothetical protein
MLLTGQMKKTKKKFSETMIRKGNHNKNKGSKQQLGFRVEGLGSKQQCSAKQNTKKQALSNSDSQTKKKNRLSETMIRPRKMRV